MTTLYLTPGDTFTYTASVTDADGDTYDLTNCTLWFTAKRHRSDTDTAAIASLYWTGAVSAGITVTTPNTGIAAIVIAATSTPAFVQAAHYWDLQIKDALGVVRTVDSGVLVVQPGVTARVTTP